MGCSNCINSSQSTYEIVIDEAFNSLTIKKTEMSVILQELNLLTYNGKQNLTETNFQIFFNKFLLPNDNTISVDTKKEWLKYWMEFYRQKPNNLRYVLIKFCCVMLSSSRIDTKDENSKDYIELISIINEYKSIYSNIEISEISERNLKFISIDEIFNILKDYIFSISLLTIPYFKNFHSDPLKFETYLNEIWKKDIIDKFIKYTFYSKQDRSMLKISIKKFLNKFLPLIKDENLLRRKLTNYSLDNLKT